jgi:hypothetical protein
MTLASAIETYSPLRQSLGAVFPILSRAALGGASFTDVRQLRAGIDDLVGVYNPAAAPFEWHKR